MICAWVQQFKALINAAINWTGPPPLSDLGRIASILKRLELIRNYLSGRLGIWHLHLSYVVSYLVTSIFITDNPFHVIKSYSLNYIGFHNELIVWADHTHEKYVEANATVLNILVGAIKWTPHITSLKPLQCMMHDNKFLLTLEIQNIGNSKWEEVICIVE